LAYTPQLTQFRCEEISAAAVENFGLEALPEHNPFWNLS